MKKFKKLFAIILILITTLIISGCENVTYMIEIENGGRGKIIQTISIDLDYDDLALKGFNKVNVQNNINSIVNQVYSKYKTQFLNNVDGLTNAEKQFIIEKIETSVSVNDNNITYKFEFASLTDYMYFNCLYGKPIANNESYADTNIFYTETQTKSKTYFSILEKSQIYSTVRSAFGNQYDINDLTYTYTYADTDAKQYSNADKHYESNGLYYHEWDFNSENLDNDIIFYRIASFKTVNWYYMALILTALFMIILFAVYEIQKFTKKKETETTEEIEF